MPILGNPEAVSHLAERLAKCPQVSRFDTEEEPQGWTLALSFSDLEASFTVFLEQQLPRLARDEGSAKETYDRLIDIGEEFRHILYHLRTVRFYDHL